ncbi:class I adenylate-forming enzyme family protein [Nakamurella endophytica]|uniref:class I adenylate-forming enzyme family protein n=1 Tax=Nakamurella endophytica TaxID=1748367 RepID=UPI00166EAC22|nr:class I adenylate-forming enzyme family protein [Nakamurella endophytica]
MPRGESVGALLRRVTAETPDRTALVDGAPGARRRWTYAELLDGAQGVARALLRCCRPGDRVAVWAPTIPEFVVAEYGIALAGMIMVTINPAFRAPEARFVLEDAGVAACLTVQDFRGHRLLEMATALESELEELRTVVDLEHAELFLAAADPAAVLPEVDPGSPAMILYTSGTTGVPKGALLAHACVTDNVTDGAANIAGRSADRTVWLALLPMFHLAGCVVAALGTATLHGTLVTVPRFDARAVLDLVEQERVSTMNIVPTLMWALLRHPDLPDVDISAIHSVMLGGATIPPELARRVRDRGIVPIVGYGLTEAPMVSATSDGDSDRDLVETIGRALPHVAVRIADPENDAPRGIGEIGEIQTRGRHTFLGYWRRPTATDAAYAADGWFKTGDLGVMDDRGVLSMAGRAKDMIIRGGENVYPREIEDHLVQLPDVLEAAVVGLPDEYYGEVVAAFVRPAPGIRPVRELAEVLSRDLTGYKVPSRWFLVDRFPTTESGKVQKFALVEAWRSGRYAEEAV